MSIEESKLQSCMIGGSGRSGTTILKVIFSKHPDVALVPEYRFPIDPDGLVDFCNSFTQGWSPYLYDLKVKRLVQLLVDIGKYRRIARGAAFFFQKFKLEQWFPVNMVPRYAGIAFERQCPAFLRLVAELEQDLLEFSYQGVWNGTRFLSPRKMGFSRIPSDSVLEKKIGNFWEKALIEVLRHQNRSVLVEDNTWAILWFDKIVKLLPGAKLVHVIRDPRDIVASYTKMRWTPEDPIQAAKWLKGILQQWFKVRSLLAEDQFLEIKLEDLVATPEIIIERVCDFWGVRWNPVLLETDLSRSHSGRWKNDFSPDVGAMLTDELSDELEILGY